MPVLTGRANDEIEHYQRMIPRYSACDNDDDDEIWNVTGVANWKSRWRNWPWPQLSTFTFLMMMIIITIIISIIIKLTLTTTVILRTSYSSICTSILTLTWTAVSWIWYLSTSSFRIFFFAKLNNWFHTYHQSSALNAFQCCFFVKRV